MKRKKIINILDTELQGDTESIYYCGAIDELEKLVFKTWNAKSKTEEIQYLGHMLTATTAEDKDRIDSIIKRLGEINE